MENNKAHDHHKAIRKLSTISPTLRKKRDKKTRRDYRRGSKTSIDGGDEREEVESRIRALQRIVPGGESLGVDKLFEETAGYIIALQCQLKAMKTLSNLFESFHNESRKFGG